MAKGIKPVRRVKKREIKEDKLVTTYFQARKYWQANSKTITKIILAALAVIVLVTFWVTSRKGSEYTASYELGVALMSSLQANPEVVSEQLTLVAERYSGTAAGNQALLYVAQTKRMAQQIEAALEAYEAYINKGKRDEYLYPAALAGKAACQEDLERYDEAALTYLKAAAANERLFVVPRYYLDAARCYKLAGDVEAAKEQLELVTSRYPDSPFAEDAKKELTRVTVQM